MRTADEPSPGPEERLLRLTRRRLAAVTLALVATLLAVVGVVTEVAATRLMDANVRRAMDAALEAALGDAADHDDRGSLRTPAGSDTFVLFLDASGRVVGNPSRVTLEGLPDASALAVASSGIDDRRDATYGVLPVRLLTRRVDPADTRDEGSGDDGGEETETGSAVAFLQVGFVLELYQAQQRELAVAIAAAVLLGIAGAGLVTLVVTRRALAPIRTAFAAERRFVAAASHELRTPVAIIRASAEVAEREGHVSPAGETLIADIIAETDRLGRLVGDLLALASAEAGAVPIDPRPTELGGWLDETARRIEPMIRVRGLRLSTDTEALRGRIAVVDAERMSQLLLVLVDNAVAHSPDGGEIRLAATRDGPSDAAISVTDQGPGVPDALRERIFEPFTRTPDERRTEGSGLGLAIARQLAGRQGATLQVGDARDRPAGWGAGACFVLRFHLVSDGRAAAGAPALRTR